MSSLFYDVMIMGFRVRISPYRVMIFDEEGEIEDNTIPDNIVKYCLAEGYCDSWVKDNYKIKVEILRIDK